MAENVETINGTSVQFVDPCENNMELMPINNDGELEEITPMQMALGTAFVGAVSIGAWELGKFLWRNVFGPTFEKLGDKYKAQKEADRKKKAGKDKNEDVIEGEFSEVDDEEEINDELEEKKKELQKKFNSDKKKRK